MFYFGRIACVGSKRSILKISIIKFIKNGKMNYYISDRTDNKVRSLLAGYTMEEIGELDDALQGIATFRYDDKTVRKIINIFSKAVEKDMSGDQLEKILYQKVYDEEGNEYAEEFYTRYDIPIIKKYNDYNITVSKNNHDKSNDTILYDIQEGIEYGKSIESSYKLSNSHDNYINPSVPVNELFSLPEGVEKTVGLDNHKKTLIAARVDRFSVNIDAQLVFPDKMIKYVIVGEEIASLTDRTDFENGLETKKNARGDYETKVRERALRNYLGESFGTIAKKQFATRYKEPEITQEINNLEFKIAKLKNISSCDAELIRKSYEAIFDQKEITDLKELLIELENKADLVMMCSGSSPKEIIDFLKNRITQIINNYKNGIKNTTNLKEIDSITHKIISNTSIDSQELNDILKYISVLYFFILYDNVDYLNLDDLNNSYVMDNIKRLIVIISILKDSNIIKNMDSNLFDIENISELMNFIKSIELNTLGEDKANELIKKIQL